MNARNVQSHVGTATRRSASVSQEVNVARVRVVQRMPNVERSVASPNAPAVRESEEPECVRTRRLLRQVGKARNASNRVII